MHAPAAKVPEFTTVAAGDRAEPVDCARLPAAGELDPWAHQTAASSATPATATANNANERRPPGALGAARVPRPAWAGARRWRAAVGLTAPEDGAVWRPLDTGRRGACPVVVTGGLS